MDFEHSSSSSTDRSRSDLVDEESFLDLVLQDGFLADLVKLKFV